MRCALLSRRRWLAGAGASALALPWMGLRAFGDEEVPGATGETPPSRAGDARELCLAGEVRARIHVEVFAEGRGHRLVRESQSASLAGDQTRLEVWHDNTRQARRAAYSRWGAWGEQRVELLVSAEGGRLTDPTLSRTSALGPEPVLLVESLDAGIVPVSSAFGQRYRVLDFASGDHLAMSLRREGSDWVGRDEAGELLARWGAAGERQGPGAFVERASGTSGASAAAAACPVAARALRPVFPFASLRGRWRLEGVRGAWPSLALSGPGQAAAVPPASGPGEVVVQVSPTMRDLALPAPAHLAPAWGVESDDVAILRFARQVTGLRGQGHGPLDDARALAEAIFLRMAARPDAGPPSALRMLSAFRGDCDHAAALLVACLRALGHPARALVGYRVWEGHLAPHAWAECWHARLGWTPVDATLPGLGPFETHLRLFEGVGSPFTLGRVLGRLRVHPA